MLMPLFRSGSDPAPESGEMSLVDHLDELRNRILACLGAITVFFVLGFFLSEPVIEALIWPIRATQREPGRPERLEIQVQPDGTLRIPREFHAHIEKLQQTGLTFVFPADAVTSTPARRFNFGTSPKQQLYYHNPIDPFMLKIKVGFMIAIACTAPFLAYQIWAFIRPGLTMKERKVVKPLLGFGLILFPIGAVFAFGVIALMLKVMQQYVPQGMEPMLSVFEFLSLLTTMMLMCGAIFEFPLGLAIAARVGLVSPATLVHYRRHVIVIIAVVAAIIAPPDIYSMLILTGILLGLYEISIAICKPLYAMHERDLRELEAVESSPEAVS